jgi:hypothetical protein
MSMVGHQENGLIPPEGVRVVFTPALEERCTLLKERISQINNQIKEKKNTYQSLLKVRMDESIEGPGVQLKVHIWNYALWDHFRVPGKPEE